jgi:hypothetical protein
VLEIEWLARRQRALDGGNQRWYIVWMDHVDCLGPPGITGVPAVVLLSGPVFQFELTRRVVDCDKGWNAVDDRTELQQCLRRTRADCGHDRFQYLTAIMPASRVVAT